MNKTTKTLLAAVFSLSLVAGCATQPEEPAGPTQEELEAQRAREAAEAAARENAACMERARVLAEEVGRYTNLTPNQQGRLDAARAAMNNDEGCRARDLLQALVSELEAARMTYTVVRGDNLWDISGKGEIYGNPFMWPLIYRSNSMKIEDPDLIYPGQELEIDKNPTEAARDAAIYHAKHRGAWSVGQSEPVDIEFVSQ